MSEFHGLMLSKPMHDYISAVVDPLGSTEPASIPDALNDSSICLQDDLQYGNFTNTFDGTIQGILYWLSYGYNIMQNQYGTHPAMVYCLNAIGLDSNNYFVLNSSSKFVTLAGANYTQIFGDASSIDTENSLISKLRLVSAGLRILPRIETVTDPSQLYLSYIVGGQVAPEDLYAALEPNNTTNIETLVRNSKGSQVYSNNSGCTARYDPMQADFQLDMLNIRQLNSSSVNWGSVRFPCIYVKFSNSVTMTTEIPVMATGVFKLEGGLKQPNAVRSAESPCDPSFPLFKTILSLPCADHPFVTSGHTFKKFNMNSRAFLKTLELAFNTSSKIPGINSETRSFLKAGGNIFRSARMRKKRKIQKRRNNNGNRKMRNGNLPGSKQPVPSIPQVDNLPQRPYRRRGKR
jgi:hypothetical protein